MLRGLVALLPRGWREIFSCFSAASVWYLHPFWPEQNDEPLSHLHGASCSCIGRSAVSLVVADMLEEAPIAVDSFAHKEPGAHMLMLGADHRTPMLVSRLIICLIVFS